MPDEPYDLAPRKQTYRSLRSDVTPISSVKELVDNALDNWKRVEHGDNPDLTIDIAFNFDERSFRIEDDSGGISDAEIPRIFALGGSSKDDIPWSIGSYGMGAKKAIIRLGERATIKSRTRGAESGYGFTVDEDWLNSSTWKVDREEFEGIEPGSTIIMIGGLDIEIGEGDASPDDDDSDTAEYDSPEAFIGQLKSEISETYEEFLIGSSVYTEGEVVIKVDGEAVDPPAQPDWSFTQYDGFHPRRYLEFKIDPDNIHGRDSPVYVSVVAGLLREGAGSAAGTDIIIQDRKIVSCNKGPTGGWGTHLPSYNSAKRRTKYKVKISAKDHPEDLPWDTQKSHIDTSNPIAVQVYNFLRRAGSAYANVEYGNFPTPFTSPYSPDKEYAWGDQPEDLDYSSRERVINDHKPDTNYSQASEIGELTDYHEEDLEIFAPYMVAGTHRSAYHASFDPSDQKLDPEYEPDEEELWHVPANAHRYSEPELHFILEYIRDIAQRHVVESRKFVFGNSGVWWQEYYERQLTEQNPELDSPRPVDELPDFDSILSEQEQISGLPSPYLIKTPTTVEPDFPLDEESEDNDENEEETDDENSESEEQETSEDDKEEDSGLEFDDLGGTETLRLISEGETHMIWIEVEEAIFVELCSATDLSPFDTTPAELGDAIVEQGIDIHEFLDVEEEDVL